MERSTSFNGKIHYKWAVFNSYVKLPEGISSLFLLTPTPRKSVRADRILSYSEGCLPGYPGNPGAWWCHGQISRATGSRATGPRVRCCWNQFTGPRKYNFLPVCLPVLLGISDIHRYPKFGDATIAANKSIVWLDHLFMNPHFCG